MSQWTHPLKSARACINDCCADKLPQVRIARKNNKVLAVLTSCARHDGCLALPTGPNQRDKTQISFVVIAVAGRRNGAAETHQLSPRKRLKQYQAIVDKSKKEQRFYLLFVRSSGIR